MKFRAIMAGGLVFAAVMLLGAVLSVLLTGCGDDGARCNRVTGTDGDAYLVCKTGHEVVYPLDENGKPIERGDGKVDYSVPK